MARNYTGEYKNYQGTPAQRRRNDARKAARRKMVAAGAVKKGDGKDVHNKDGNPLNSNKSNLREVRKSKNRSFPRNRKSGKK